MSLLAPCRCVFSLRAGASSARAMHALITTRVIAISGRGPVALSQRVPLARGMRGAVVGRCRSARWGNVPRLRPGERTDSCLYQLSHSSRYLFHSRPSSALAYNCSALRL
ncbi:hypothetical protein MRX96_041611 [Rhipicephalus microplus]